MIKINAETYTKQFIASHWRFHGSSSALTRDRRTNWTSKFWKRLCELSEMKQRISAYYHLQTDGITERANQDVETYITVHVSNTK